MIEIIRSRPIQGALAAIARRRRLGAKLSDCLVAAAIEAPDGVVAVTTLLRNHDAEIDPETMDQIIAELHRLMAEFRTGNDGERLDDYSDANIAFHQVIIKMSGCTLLAEMTENLFIHMRAIRKITIHQNDRAARSIVDHMRIIEALERRDAELAERLAREHTLGLAAHVERHGDFLDAVSPI